MDMSDAAFPLVFANDEVRLLTALAIGFLFGFALERGGFGNARKLAAQFYLNDMTVFKVMFTAILVAMVGLYTLAAAGWVDMGRVWINPTFLWAQVVGGFLLGVGFIMSGLCPGTAVVSAASGRWDGAVTLAGMAVGIAGFALAVDALPALERLYSAGSMEVSVLPRLVGLSTLPFILAVVVMAGSAFIGAEAVERIFRDRRPPLELAPASFPRAKFVVAGVLGLVLVAGLGLRPTPAAPPEDRPITLDPLAPLALAQRIIERDPDLLVLDLRNPPEPPVPGAYPVPDDDDDAAAVLAGAGPSTDVVMVTHDGRLDAVPGVWPDRRYRLLEGGWAGWEAQVLTPAEPASRDLAAAEWARRQNGIAAYFSGAAVQAPVVGPPPAVPAAAGGQRPRRGGC
jgi:uncharacterized membrane protein YedE/YeeE